MTWLLAGCVGSQNRTICELIRRRRNDENYGRQEGKDVSEDLLLCWGIGPSKAAEGGFGWQLLAELGKDEVEVLIRQSRALTTAEESKDTNNAEEATDGIAENIEQNKA